MSGPGVERVYINMHGTEITILIGLVINHGIFGVYNKRNFYDCVGTTSDHLYITNMLFFTFG